MRRRLTYLVRRSYGWLPEWLYHFVYGVLSGIPICCVWYFVLHRHDITSSRGFAGKYTPCPSCFRHSNAVYIYFAAEDKWLLRENWIW